MNSVPKFSLEEGKFLVKLARQSVEYFLKNKKYLPIPHTYPENLNKTVGIFITLSTFPGENLRGCIGYPYAFGPLIELCVSASTKAACEDPRFECVSTKELDNIVFEVTILSPMILLDQNKPFEEQIEIGRDGLLVTCDTYGKSGLLLPQVAVEWGFDKKKFLKEVCRKASLNDNCINDRNCKFYRFESQIFKEVSPNSDIKEEVLNERNI
ncbi:putative ACR [Desulfurella amilsii]|uniref:Putative ACR n=1 Tax=Desulfurella amilsii TaxID=1562698 RepID=A0A1X4XWL6_9BACT|nr:TIGR00296 family protein [Desulfurella amilsii]OSS41926.1 putative ACR [Desulfurella amilsii]